MKEYIVETRSLKNTIKWVKYGKGIGWRRFSCERSGIRCYYRKKRIREKYTFAYAGWTGCANRWGSVGRG
ncbi:hypothetical protein COPCOM_00699 [Coprococcus comes ATCC 27758]|uniref:Uncharacterized protein n=1 Tax=Coprococcus comes ATCC 27758 TaxID=470146 RepID=C0B6C7_9FIRM|nr:hypothetical protein COPCOM_00699 [Coprococcus comes ATCC 27758]